MAAQAAVAGDVGFFVALQNEQLQKALLFRDEDGRSLLHNAASSSRTEVVEHLLQRGASALVDVTDEEAREGRSTFNPLA